MDLVDMASQTPSYGQILSLSYPRTRCLGRSSTVVLTRLKSEGLNILARMPLPDVQNPHWWILVLDTCDLNHVRSLLNPIVRNIKSSPYFDAQLPISEKVCDI
jgi:hypothetical protein